MGRLGSPVLFRSDDDGDSWELMRGLWDQPERADWFGGGFDDPGIHSICVVSPQQRACRDSRVLATLAGPVPDQRLGGVGPGVADGGLRAARTARETRLPRPHRVAARRRGAGGAGCPGRIFRSDDEDRPVELRSGLGFRVYRRDGMDVTPRPRGSGPWPTIASSPVDGALTAEDRGRGRPVVGQGGTGRPLRPGLPPRPPISAIGTTLAMGSTTGGLWTRGGLEAVDACGGARTGIYCVRFLPG